MSATPILTPKSSHRKTKGYMSEIARQLQVITPKLQKVAAEIMENGELGVTDEERAQYDSLPPEQQEQYYIQLARAAQGQKQYSDSMAYVQNARQYSPTTEGRDKALSDYMTTLQSTSEGQAHLEAIKRQNPRLPVEEVIRANFNNAWAKDPAAAGKDILARINAFSQSSNMNAQPGAVERALLAGGSTGLEAGAGAAAGWWAPRLSKYVPGIGIATSAMPLARTVWNMGSEQKRLDDLVARGIITPEMRKEQLLQMVGTAYLPGGALDPAASPVQSIASGLAVPYQLSPLGYGIETLQTGINRGNAAYNAYQRAKLKGTTFAHEFAKDQDAVTKDLVDQQKMLGDSFWSGKSPAERLGAAAQYAGVLSQSSTMLPWEYMNYRNSVDAANASTAQTEQRVKDMALQNERDMWRASAIGKQVNADAVLDLNKQKNMQWWRETANPNQYFSDVVRGYAGSLKSDPAEAMNRIAYGLTGYDNYDLLDDQRKEFINNQLRAQGYTYNGKELVEQNSANLQKAYDQRFKTNQPAPAPAPVVKKPAAPVASPVPEKKPLPPIEDPFEAIRRQSYFTLPDKA